MSEFYPVSSRYRFAPGLLVSLALLLAGLGAVFGGMGRASAGLSWCAGDPVISVNGQLISVVVSVPSDKVDNVEMATVVFHVPSNADASIVFVDQQYFP